MSNVTAISLSASVEVNSIAFAEQASSYTITLPPSIDLTVSGAGVANASGLIQHFVVSGGAEQATLTFSGNATAGAQTDYLISGGDGGMGGNLFFFGSSTAGTATYTVGAALDEGSAGGFVNFSDSSSAGASTFVVEGQSFPSEGATLQFFGGSAGAATLIADGGSVTGGAIQFFTSDVNTARVIVFGNGHLDFLAQSIIGSIEGDGIVSIDQSVTVGNNNLSTNLSGVIQSSGSLTKIGTGTLTLSGPNTYTGGTNISQGTILATTAGASATGTGVVHVNGGTLGGTSRLSGAIAVGSGSGTGAFLSPGIGGPATLTTRSRVTFLTDGTYVCELSTTKKRADQISAKGVQIQNGAVFSFFALGNRKLTSGSTFIVINNTDRSAISGTFSNLADGSTFTSGLNTYVVSYEGGSGNDLTLTVQ